jgi:hypothetical protein
MKPAGGEGGWCFPVQNVREGPAAGGFVLGVKWLEPRRPVGARALNGCPAVTYSPTPSRVQYHRRCGS